MSRFVIGDVHGQYEGLMRLLEAIGLTGSDRLFFLGDLIDRGPQSAAVVDWVMHSGSSCILGNHEQMCIEAFRSSTSSAIWRGWLLNGGSKTLDSYCDRDMLDKHLNWMSQLPLYVDLGDVWLVHAGVDPRLSLEQQGAFEFCWIREAFHRSTEPYFADKTIITGHTITFVFPGLQPGQLAQGIGWLDIDTGAYHPKSGWLTALNLDTCEVHQVNVYTQSTRSLPLSELAVQIEPLEVKHAVKRKQELRQN